MVGIRLVESIFSRTWAGGLSRSRGTGSSNPFAFAENSSTVQPADRSDAQPPASSAVRVVRTMSSPQLWDSTRAARLTVDPK